MDEQETFSKAQLDLQPKYCPICREANKQDADFCFKCNWIISKKGVQETKEKDAAAAKEAEDLKKQFEEIKPKHENTKQELTELINSREAQFEKHMSDILEA